MVRLAAAILASTTTLLAGCSSPSASSALSQDRITALTQLGANGTRADVPKVLPSLASDDPLVRWTAQRTMMQLAGTTNGYDWAASRNDRERAIETWKTWCVQQGVAPAPKDSRRG
jgi:HEAT repeat protein